MRRTGKSELFYGYWILAASLLLLFIMSGVGFYSFGIFFKPIQEDGVLCGAPVALICVDLS